MSEDGRHALNGAPIRVLGLGGSTRTGSKSRILLRNALDLAARAGAEVTMADVRDLRLPMFDDELAQDACPAEVMELLAATRAADAFIFCSPTYHGTVSGAVKNALDHLNPLGDDDPSYLAGKPVGLMAVGGGGAANVLTSLQHATRALNGVAIPTVVMAGGSAFRDGEIVDEMVARRVGWMVGELLDYAVRLRKPAPVVSVAR